MVAAQEDEYLGWTVTTTCREVKPDDWQPGDSIKYAARACIEFKNPMAHPPGWHFTGKVSFPAHHERLFDDWTHAHEVMKIEAQAEIHMMRK